MQAEARLFPSQHLMISGCPAMHLCYNVQQWMNLSYICCCDAPKSGPKLLQVCMDQVRSYNVDMAKQLNQ